MAATFFANISAAIVIAGVIAPWFSIFTGNWVDEIKTIFRTLGLFGNVFYAMSVFLCAILVYVIGWLQLLNLEE